MLSGFELDTLRRGSSGLTSRPPQSRLYVKEMVAAALPAADWLRRITTEESCTRGSGRCVGCRNCDADLKNDT